MFGLLGKVVSRGWWIMLALWIGVTIWLTSIAPHLEDVTTEGPGVELPKIIVNKKTGEELCSSRVAAELISHAFGQESSRLIVIFQRPAKLAEADYALIDNAVRTIRDLGAVDMPGLKEKGNIVSFTLSPSQPYFKKRLTSIDGRTVIAAFALTSQFVDVKTHKFIDDAVKYLDGFAASHASEGWKYYITDSAAIGRDYEIEADHSLKRTQYITVSLVVVILVLLYRSLPGPAVTLATVVLSVHVATCVMAILGRYWMEVSKLVPIYMIVIIYGSVTDYCMFIIGRFREEMARGHSRFEAVRIAVSQVGAATTASALTTIAGLAMMWFADFAIFRSTGPILGIGLAVGLLASITFMPALIVLFGRHLFWPARGVATVSIDNTRSGRFWGKIANIVVARPGLILVVAVGLFLPLATFGGHASPTYDIFDELPRNSPSVVGNRVILDNFPENSRTESVTMVFKMPKPKLIPGEAGEPNLWRTWTGLRVLDCVTEAILAHHEDVVEVRSVTRPLGVREPVIEEYLGNDKETSLFKPRWLKASTMLAPPIPGGGSFARYTSADENITRIDIVLRHDPFTERALVVAADIRYWANPVLQANSLGDCQVYVGGVSAHMYDLTKVTKKDFRRLRYMVLGVLFVILAVVLRGAIAPIYLLATMVLNYFATLGVLQLVFVNLLGFDGLDWKVEFFLFVLLVAIGVDYNIYIMSRLAEEVRRRPFRQALHHAIVFTGAIITSCGIIMAGTFGSMMASTLAVMIELGAAMAIGVLMDTFIFRPLVVPSIALLVEKVREKIQGTRPV